MQYLFFILFFKFFLLLFCDSCPTFPPFPSSAQPTPLPQSVPTLLSMSAGHSHMLVPPSSFYYDPSSPLICIRQCYLDRFFISWDRVGISIYFIQLMISPRNLVPSIIVIVRSFPLITAFAPFGATKRKPCVWRWRDSQSQGASPSVWSQWVLSE